MMATLCSRASLTASPSACRVRRVISTFAVVWIGAPFEQQPHDGPAPGDTREVENRNRSLKIAMRHRSIRVGARVQQRFNHR
jgi:hypothetical protein